jgi:hypothetical protein
LKSVSVAVERRDSVTNCVASLQNCRFSAIPWKMKRRNYCLNTCLTYDTPGRQLRGVPKQGGERWYSRMHRRLPQLLPVPLPLWRDPSKRRLTVPNRLRSERLTRGTSDILSRLLWTRKLRRALAEYRRSRIKTLSEKRNRTVAARYPSRSLVQT